MMDWIQGRVPLSQVACALALVIMAINALCLLWPPAVRRAVAAFPRSRGPAWLLTALDLAWVAVIVLHAELGRFDWLKPYIYAAAPVAFFLIVIFMDELLAPRALGGLLLLLANPVIRAARWHESDWRWVVMVLAYAWAVAGIVLVLSPFYFRRVAEWANRTDGRCRFLGALRFGLGLLLLALALAVY
ncbi:MAG: hypothetical protein KA248_09990 [Kiritimatiellae bacterium]|nr:hypothetical protein [Kiritimatiellia bacterium]